MIDARQHALFQELLGSARTFVLTTHMNPDGDAIGTEVGLERFLLSRGAEVRVINHDPTPPTLKFLEPTESGAEVYEAFRHDAVLSGADLLVLLDNSAPDRLGRMERVMRQLAAKTLCIDHHPTRGTPWSHNILDEGSCATAAIVYELTQGCGWTPDGMGARALYVGLATDTGFFRFNSTTPRTHEIAAELLEHGVDPALCYREIYERNSPEHTRLLGSALAGLKLDAGGRVASIRITRAMVEACHADGVDASEMTTALLATDGVWIALLFREMDDGRIKVSLRSKGEIDVHRLASGFGGGGHRNASGIVVAGAIDRIEAEVIARAAELLAGTP